MGNMPKAPNCFSFHVYCPDPLANILSSPLLPSPANINHLFLPSVISNQLDGITYIFGHQGKSSKFRKTEKEFFYDMVIKYKVRRKIDVKQVTINFETSGSCRSDHQYQFYFLCFFSYKTYLSIKTFLYIWASGISYILSTISYYSSPGR